MSAGRAEDGQTESHAPDHHSLAHQVRIVTTLDESVHQPSSNQQVGESSKEPGNAGIKNGVQQVNMQGNRKIAGQPGQQKKESIVISAPPEGESVNFALL